MPIMFCLLENRENRENNLVWYGYICLGSPYLWENRENRENKGLHGCLKTEKTEKTEKTTLYDMGTFALGLPVCEKTEKTGKTRAYSDATDE